MVTREREKVPTKTSYDLIGELQDQIKQMAGATPIIIKESHSYYVDSLAPKIRRGETIIGYRIPLNDGSSISIVSERIPEGESSRSERRVSIGDVKIKVVEHEDNFVISYHTEFPVQVQIGNFKMDSRAGFSGHTALGHPEQELVVDWITRSIKDGKLGESPVKMNIFPQGQAPKS